VSHRTRVSGVWTPSPIEREAAWELYVELATRITTVEQKPGAGIVREELNSIYSLFACTRDILRKYGPELAAKGRPGAVTFAGIAVEMVNTVLRPLLTKWHPALAEWEATRLPGTSVVVHERGWEQIDVLRTEVAETRHVLLDLAAELHDAMQIEPLIGTV
jgi:hypothetical protein